MIKKHDLMINYSSFISITLAVVGLILCCTNTISHNQTSIGIFTFLFMMAIVLLAANYRKGINKKYIELNNYLTTFSSESIDSLNID
ncbi:hypothetical protein [Ehrlichia japonica]|uniref:Uncharacterized protein n=1 Tax=Ehrlichia japonica TaxID=391036 RepID=X5GLE0_9RICK|nr:hypothetical protein [Ehrlichia japonica]AHX04956.1 hypothetical protein EHF_0634 [Ehrlichia japonica]